LISANLQNMVATIQLFRQREIIQILISQLGELVCRHGSVRGKTRLLLPKVL
jgi:hypothetical protein